MVGATGAAVVTVAGVVVVAEDAAVVVVVSVSAFVVVVVVIPVATVVVVVVVVVMVASFSFSFVFCESVFVGVRISLMQIRRQEFASGIYFVSCRLGGVVKARGLFLWGSVRRTCECQINQGRVRHRATRVRVRHCDQEVVKLLSC